MKKQAILIADLGYGDAGKGSIVDFLARETDAHTVIRYNGGAQAAHNVITPDGRHHTFAQFGSATFLPGVRTHLSRFMLIHPLAMLAEERHLQSVGVMDAFEQVTVENKALIISPYQQAANRIKEIARGSGLHGSCGLGVGETMSDWLTYGDEVLFAGDLLDRNEVKKKLSFLREQKIAQLRGFLSNYPSTNQIQEEMGVFTDPALIEATTDIFIHWANLVHLVGQDHLQKILQNDGTVIFEGAQGVLLDEWWGFYPYNSWSTLTYKNADTLLRESQWDGETLKLGLMRTYMTRHGAGPMVTEDADMTASLPDLHNRNNAWQRGFRVGPLDFPALRYALNVLGGIDGVVVTHLDRLQTTPRWRICDRYYHNSNSPRQYIEDDGRNICIPADPTNLAEQENLTNALMKFKPVLEYIDRDISTYLEVIEDKLGYQILLTSAGYTANEKIWRTNRKSDSQIKSNFVSIA
jgi:adenylosuccinate synthase